jgi:metallo-beta-lactamase family protein
LPARCTPRRARATCAPSCCPTAAYLQEEDAAFANRHGFSKHAPALPLYTRNDDALEPQADQGVALGHVFSRSAAGTPASPAGHILGAASVLLEVAGHRILFSGDLGRPDDLIMNPPAGRRWPTRC